MRTACLLLVLSVGCTKKPPQGSVEGFALSFVEVARAGTPGNQWVDDELVQRVRRAERLKMAARANAPAPVLAKVWNEEPEPGSAAERGTRQRERAAGAIRQHLQGKCTAEREPNGARQRLAAITLPPGQLTDARPELDALAHELKSAELVRVTCEHGAVGLLAVPRDGSFRVVDLFQVNENKPPVPVSGPQMQR